VSGGKEFQSLAAERLKALPSMMLRQAGGTVRWMEEEGWSGDMEEVRQRMDGLKGKQKEFVIYHVGDREPVELLQDGGNEMR